MSGKVSLTPRIVHVGKISKVANHERRCNVATILGQSGFAARHIVKDTTAHVNIGEQMGEFITLNPTEIETFYRIRDAL